MTNAQFHIITFGFGNFYNQKMRPPFLPELDNQFLYASSKTRSTEGK